MDDVLRFLAQLFTDMPYVCLSWPAVAMVLGLLVTLCSKKAATDLAVNPRTAQGLIGIITAPFVHANFAHLLANLPPFLVLGTLLLRRGTGEFIEVSLTVAVAQGVILWLFGRKAAHVGMSGVIFGLLGYLVAVGWYTRTTPDLLAAGGVLLFYGGMLAGVAPARDGTSWEGHLFGLIAGLAVAWLRFGY